MSWDPITRIIGNLGIHTKIDFDNREVAECQSTSSLFRGYSVFMRGKDPRDAHFITSRICGICGDNHATCSIYAQNMAYGIKPPPLAEWIVNLGEAAEYMFDHTIFQDNLVFVDFCEQMVKETNPSLLEKAERTPARTPRSTATRRSRTSCAPSTPSRARCTRRRSQMSRLTREMFCLMEGRHVHPSTLYPGGVGTVATPQVFTDYLSRLMKFIDFVKKAVPLNDDIFDFFYDAMPGYEKVGKRRILLGCWGSFQNPDICDYRYENMGELGPRHVRHARHRRRRRAGHHQPGRHQPRHPHPARQLLLRRLGRARRSFVTSDPLGNPIDQRHPWNQTTLPKPQKREPREGPLQLGDEPALVLARRPASTSRSTPAAVRSRACGRRRWPGSSTRPSCRPPGNSVRIQLPKTASLREMEFEWKVPQWANTHRARPRPRLLHRLRGRDGAATSSTRRWTTSTRATRRSSRTSTCPTRGSAAASTRPCGACSRTTSSIRDGKIANYHPYPPTPWNASPRDSLRHSRDRTRTRCRALPIFEENGRDDFKGIDIMRTVRSFDPCLPCGVHMYLGNGKVLERHHSPMLGVGGEGESR